MYFSVIGKDRRSVFCWAPVRLVVYKVNTRTACAAASCWIGDERGAQSFLDDGCCLYKVVGEMVSLIEQRWDRRGIRS